MSRIEEALLKASRNRGQQPISPSVEQKEKAPAFPSQIDPIPVDNPFVVAVCDPHSPATEEYRKLRSFILNASQLGTLQNTIIVTSALMGEGKSITSLNLAITLAEEFDHTVLLVDADLRKPSLHSYLGIKPDFGLSECLSQGRDVGDAIIRTGLGKLSLLPAGQAMKNPTELLASSRTREVFNEIKNRYHDRFIIIDTPPTLPFAETRTISHMADSVVIVVREGVSNYQQVKEALQSLKDIQCLGIVYNDAHLSTVTSHYGNYGYYGYVKPRPGEKLSNEKKMRFSLFKRNKE